MLYAVDRPRPNFEKVDTALVMALSQGVPAVLCFNKLDLATDDFRRELEGYRRLAIPVLTVSALNGDGFDALMPLFVGKTTLLWGPSGVGKSTLLNRVIPGLGQATGAVSRGTGMGRHTTTAVAMFAAGDDTWIVDTPGWRHLTPGYVSFAALETVFPDEVTFASRCRFRDCRHDREPGCAVRAALERGELSERRVRSYKDLLALAAGK